MILICIQTNDNNNHYTFGKTAKTREREDNWTTHLYQWLTYIILGHLFYEPILLDAIDSTECEELNHSCQATPKFIHTFCIRLCDFCRNWMHCEHIGHSIMTHFQRVFETNGNVNNFIFEREMRETRTNVLRTIALLCFALLPFTGCIQSSRGPLI